MYISYKHSLYISHIRIMGMVHWLAAFSLAFEMILLLLPYLTAAILIGMIYLLPCFQFYWFHLVLSFFLLICVSSLFFFFLKFLGLGIFRFLLWSKDSVFMLCRVSLLDIAFYVILNWTHVFLMYLAAIYLWAVGKFSYSLFVIDSSDVSWGVSN